MTSFELAKQVVKPPNTGLVALEITAGLMKILNEDGEEINDLKKMILALEKEKRLAALFNQTNVQFLQGLYYTLSHYVHQNRKDASDPDWQKRTAIMQSAIEFAIAHVAEGNLLGLVLEDQEQEPEYRALSLAQVHTLIYIYQNAGLIKQHLTLDPNGFINQKPREEILAILKESVGI